jgi:hypothetical protein
VAAVEIHLTVSSLHKRYGIKNFSVLQQSVPTGDPELHVCVCDFTVKFLENPCLQGNTNLHLLTSYIIILRISSEYFQVKHDECEKQTNTLNKKSFHTVSCP